MSAVRPRAGPDWRRRLGILALSAVVVGTLGEATVRWLLFGESELAARLGKRLRNPFLYAASADKDDFWKLQARFEGARAVPIPSPDPRLGWTAQLAPGTYLHPLEASIGERRPVLLYGDSFAQCVTLPEVCWEGLFQETELARDHAFLNFGVGGYGLDQIALLLEATLARFAARRPIVMIGILVDDDLERCSLSIRGWPKPRFRLEGGELVLEEPRAASVRAFIDAHPPSIRSYLARLTTRALGRRGHFEPTWVETETLPERRALCRAILERIAETLDAHGVRDWFFVLFHASGALQDLPRARWQEELVLEFARARGARYVSTRPYLEAAGLGDPGRIGRLFALGDPAQEGHYNDAGNRAAFEAFLQGLRGDFGPARVEHVRERARAGGFEPRTDLPRRFLVFGREGRWRARSLEPCLRVSDRGEAEVRLSVRPGENGANDVEIPLAGAMRLRARVRAAANPRDACGSEPLSLAILRGDGTWARSEHAIGGAEVEVVVEGLDGIMLALRVERRGPLPMCGWLVLERLRLE